jgi:uncharacterized membrane protein
MVVHFTIAVNYLCTLGGLVGLIWRKDHFWGKLFFLLLALGILSTIAAGAAGVISESYISTRPSGIEPVFHDHKTYAMLTGLFQVIAIAVQSFSWWRTRSMRVSFWAFLLSIASTVCVSMAGHLGGTMVYQYGFGVH